jgi:hypothetical protein
MSDQPHGGDEPIVEAGGMSTSDGLGATATVTGIWAFALAFTAAFWTALVMAAT